MVLRTTYPEGTINYTSIGDNFQLVLKDKSKEDFERTCVIQFGENDEHFRPHCYGFLVHHTGSKVEPLYEKQESVVMIFRDDSFDTIWVSRDAQVPAKSS